MYHAETTAAIILAAGTSSRMGAERNKLLLPLHNQPVLAHVLKAVVDSQARPIILVLGHQAPEVRVHIQPFLPASSFTIAVNNDYRQGQSTSLKVGLQTLTAFTSEKLTGVESVIFLLGDQPMISSTLIDQLITLRKTSGKRIALPLYQGKRGNPVVFSLDLVPELLQTSGDEGGRSVLKRHTDEIATLETNEVSANLDVDTWEAYLQVQAAWAEQTQHEPEKRKVLREDG
jgi:molybdenum cofactor cytidylyltransferase